MNSQITQNEDLNSEINLSIRQYQQQYNSLFQQQQTQTLDLNQIFQKYQLIPQDIFEYYEKNFPQMTETQIRNQAETHLNLQSCGINFKNSSQIDIVIKDLEQQQTAYIQLLKRVQTNPDCPKLSKLCEISTNSKTIKHCLYSAPFLQKMVALNEKHIHMLKSFQKEISQKKIENYIDEEDVLASRQKDIQQLLGSSRYKQYEQEYDNI